MKKVVLIIVAIVSTIQLSAQCDAPTIKDAPTVYAKSYTASWKITSEQDKYITTIFTSVVEPALKSTKGLKGTWQALHGSWESTGGFGATPDGLTTTTIQMYMQVMGCSKEKKTA
ncbi:MAG: hypothetical protein QM802_03730 [Agriterribacter sp.]